MKELLSRLKSGKIDNMYVFYGTEPFLIKLYEKRLKEAILGDNDAIVSMNETIFEGEGHKTADIISTAETPPFLADKRLIVLKNTGYLQTGKKDEAEELLKYIVGMPETVVILFIELEKAPDKRGRLYKKISTEGLTVEFTTPIESELSSWIIRLFREKGKSISAQTAGFMLRFVCGTSESVMDKLYMEVNKLAAYIAINPENRLEANISDVEAVCSASLEGRIFALVKEIGSKNIQALTSFGNLMVMKEPPLMVLSMIARQFRFILLSKGLREKGMGNREIAERTGLRDFMITEFLRQSVNFTHETLENALMDCLSAEYSIKSGKMPDKLAVEMLIIKYCTAHSR